MFVSIIVYFIFLIGSIISVIQRGKQWNPQRYRICFENALVMII